jgi:pimeloyl-ACP methyl ester carboxylesterase
MQTSSVVTMPDGRNVRVRQLGPDQGSPVVHLHGIPSSCVEFAHLEAVLTRLDVRLISIERPGYGVSDPNNFESVAAWVGDLERAAKVLGLDRFSLLGFSGGGVFALAGAAALPTHVDRVAVVGCPAPLTGPEFLDGMAVQNQEIWMLGRAGYWILAEALAPMASDSSTLAEQLLDSLPAADAAVFADSAARANFSSAVIEGLRQGVGATARDLALIASPWGFDLSQVTQRVNIWHGDADRNIPVNHGARLSESLPRARARVRPGRGHYEAYAPKSFEQILRSLNTI